MKIQIFTLLIFISVLSFAQKPIEYNINLNIEKKARKTIEEQTINWINTQGAKITKSTEDTLWATASINFNNTAVFKESKTYNRVYREQTKGIITYTIKVYFENNIAQARLMQFKHKPSDSFDNINFGLITNSSSAPKQTQELTSQEYSKEVWDLLKKTIDEYTKVIEPEIKDVAIKI